MHDWSERDLLRWVEAAGFSRIDYEARFEVKRRAPIDDFDVASRRAANPLVPSLGEALEQALDPTERERFVAWLRPRLETGEGVVHSASGYLAAVK